MDAGTIGEIVRFATHHWKLLVGVWLLSNVVSAMPTPAGTTGALGSWWYRWLFGALHSIFGNAARVVATLPAGIAQRVLSSALTERPAPPQPPEPPAAKAAAAGG